MKLNGIEKLRAIGAELNAFAFERAEEIKMALVALLAQHHILLLGAPGLAKSMIAWQICRRITRSRYHEHLLSKYTTDKDLFVSRTDVEEEVRDGGTKSVRFVHSMDDTLATAEIAFLDEVFKANSATLNSLLTLINERRFHMNGKVYQAPLMTVFAASNELPEDGEGLEALYDRFFVRFVVNRVTEPGNRLAMRRVSRSRRAEKASGKKVTDATISLTELQELQQLVSLVDFPENLDERVEEIVDALYKEGITVSDRRDVRVDPLLQAHALLDGRDKVEVQDLAILQHCLWNDPSQIKTVQRIVLTIANPMENKAIELLDQAAEIHSNAITAGDGSAGAEANSKLKKLVIAIDELAEQAKQQGAPTAKIIEVKEKIQNFNKEVVKACLGLDI